MKVLADHNIQNIRALLKRVELELEVVEYNKKIPGSFWGEPEAGLIKNTLYASSQTPIHSILHETGHYICMTSERRASLHTNALGKTKGYFVEENAVCYLQILLADEIDGFGQKKVMQDMDDWGYSFRLGSTQKWFKEDSQDAVQWLLLHKLINADKEFQFVLRQ